MFLKRSLFKLLGPYKYYLLVSRLFFFLYDLGLLRIKEKFAYHYFVRKLVKSGDTVIDVGANMGYYTKIFAHKAGKKGHVYAVEPVSLYRKILERNIRDLSNVSIIPFALGSEEGKKVKMGIPEGSGFHRHGLTRVLENVADPGRELLFEETMHTPEYLFGKLERIDYIKCDVEGYEIYVIPLFYRIIEKHRPIIQIETSKESRAVITPMLVKIGYRAFHIENSALKSFDDRNKPAGDIIYYCDID